MKRGRLVQFEPEVAPAAGHAIAVVFVGDVETADDGDRIVDEEEFAVIAEREMAQRNGIEDTRAAAGRFECLAMNRQTSTPWSSRREA